MGLDRRMSMPKAFAILAMAGSAFAEEYGLYEPAQNEARFFFFNSTGSAQTLSLLGAAILIAVIAYLVFASTGTEGSYYNNGFLDGLNIVSWISMLQDVYEKFDYNDLDCQKRLICEVMKEPGFYGAVA